MALPTASDNAFTSLLIIEGTEPSAPAASRQRLYFDSTTKALKKTNSSGADFNIGGVSLLLDYALSADVTNQALTAGTAFDMFANQNFTVLSAQSLVEVIVRGVGFCNDNTDNSVLTRINIDSAGTPVIKYFPGTYNASGNGTVNSRNNPLIGGTVYLSGLTAATHTIKVQVLAVAQNDHLYCRAATAPPTGAEFLTLQVVEHLNG